MGLGEIKGEVKVRNVHLFSQHASQCDSSVPAVLSNLVPDQTR